MDREGLKKTAKQVVDDLYETYYTLKERTLEVDSINDTENIGKVMDTLRGLDERLTRIYESLQEDYERVYDMRSHNRTNTLSCKIEGFVKDYLGCIGDEWSMAASVEVACRGSEPDDFDLLTQSDTQRRGSLISAAYHTVYDLYGWIQDFDTAVERLVPFRE